MTRFTQLATTSAAALLISGGMAFAQCVDTETTASTNNTTASGSSSADVAKRMDGGVAKDGSMAPLEAAPDSTGQQAASGSSTPSSGSDQQAASSTDTTGATGTDQQSASNSTASGSASSGSSTSGSTGADQQAASDTTAPATGENSDQQSASADGRASSDTVQKDGGEVPLAQSEQDQTGNQIAMSQQDVEAQQEGEATMAAKTDPDC